MIINRTSKPFPHLIIEEFYSENELNIIFNELKFLKTKMLTPDKTGSARLKATGSTNNEYLKNSLGIFLDNFYAERKSSDILELSKKIFCKEILEICSSMDLIMQYFSRTNADSTLVNYYGDGEYYKAHADSSVISCITVIHETPKNYSGGELIFPEYDYTLDIQNNQTIIFPSILLHEVSTVKLKNADEYSGRFSITKFAKII
jgi:Rps23 Pro-64 3,4-dihydroxylase Tpa1-like proline 4-hydroxylase